MWAWPDGLTCEKYVWRVVILSLLARKGPTRTTISSSICGYLKIIKFKYLTVRIDAPIFHNQEGMGGELVLTNFALF